MLVVGEGSNLRWLVTDHLGSTRMTADSTGSLTGMKRQDYLPFGEELGAGVGIRTAGQGYVGDQVRQKFGAKERDSETGLDYFINRYFSSVQGRFTSIDP
jgi:RHS repeat-associated protein